MNLFLALTAGGSILLLLLLLLRALLGKRLSSTAYYYAWLVVLLRFLLPMPGLLPIGRQAESRPAQTINRIEMQRPPLPELREEQNTGRNYEEFWLSTMDQTGEQVPANPSEPVREDVSIDWKSPVLWLSFWAAGAAGSLGFYLFSYFRFSRQLRLSLHPPQESDLEIYQSFPLRKPALYRCNGIRTPLMFGVLHPRIILPDQCYEEEVLRNVLLHELMHYRRKDTLYKWFAVLVYAVQWFNPLTYWMRREIGQACELSCDEMLMRHMDRQARQAYGETLLNMAASAALPAGVVATTFATEKKNLKERLEQIMEFKTDRKRMLTSLLAFVLLLSCAFVTGPKSSAEGAPAVSQTEVTVSTVDEFLNAIAPNTAITLKAGTYDLSKASSYGEPQRGACWYWQEVYDGYQLYIYGISNLTIQGEGPDKVTISAVPRYADVLSFYSCSNITLKGFTAGHTEAPAFCAGNVLGFDNCGFVNIDSCGMFGCGVLGIYGQSVTDMTVTNSEIYDCTYGAVDLYSARNVVFDSCTFRNHASAQDPAVGYLFYLDSSDNVQIRNSAIRNNYAQNLLVMGYSRNVIFAGNTVENNSFLSAVFSSQRNSPVVEGCSFTGNSIFTWYEGNGVFAVDAEGHTLGKEELQNMTQRSIGPEDENLIPERIDVTGQELVSPAADGAYHVNTVDEFLSVIGNDRTILLEAELYDLSAASDYGTPGSEYYFWRENYDGPELVITGVHNMTIDTVKTPGSMAALHHTITATPRYADVIAFQYCDNINLLNFTAGHTQAPGECSGGVLAFQNCSTVQIASCRLYGCGTLGIDASNSSSFVIENCEIFDCSQGGIQMWNVDGIFLNDCSIHDVNGPALNFVNCGDKTWNGQPINGLEGTYSISSDGSLQEFDWNAYFAAMYPEEYGTYTEPEEMNPVIAKRVAEGELKRLQDLGIIVPEVVFDGELEYSAYSDGYEQYGRNATHGFYARDYSGKYLINFRIDDTSTGDIRSASFEAVADENDEPTGSVEWDGETYYYYDNFDDIFPADLTVGALCDKLAQYWGFTGWHLEDTYDEFYAENFAAPNKDLLVSELPEGNYYATVTFDGDQEGAPMFFQKMHFPGRVCFMFGEGHAVG